VGDMSMGHHHCVHEVFQVILEYRSITGTLLPRKSVAKQKTLEEN
jgi:hypothetical protein